MRRSRRVYPSQIEMGRTGQRLEEPGKFWTNGHEHPLACATDRAHCERHFAQCSAPATHHTPGSRDGTSASSTNLNGEGIDSGGRARQLQARHRKRGVARAPRAGVADKRSPGGRSAGGSERMEAMDGRNELGWGHGRPRSRVWSRIAPRGATATPSAS